VCVDEITHMPPRDAVDLAMSITQPGHRIRLQTDGVERASIGSYKATIMLATANNSLHGVLSLDNAAGTAGSMRVFEILFIPGKVHQKWEADEFLFKLKMNFGHIGEQFIYHVLKHKEAVIARVREVMKEIDTAANIKSSERFWSATVAASPRRRRDRLPARPAALQRRCAEAVAARAPDPGDARRRDSPSTATRWRSSPTIWSASTATSSRCASPRATPTSGRTSSTCRAPASCSPTTISTSGSCTCSRRASRNTAPRSAPTPRR
jgi:hypothetical protein